MPSNSNGVSSARQEYLSVTPQTVMPVHWGTARQARVTPAYCSAWDAPDPAMSNPADPGTPTPVDPTKPPVETDDVVAEVLRIVPGGVDVAVDTSGNQHMMVNALRSCCYHGMFLPVAAAGTIDHFDVGHDVMIPMRTMKGTCEGESIPKTFIPQMVQWYKGGRFPVDRILSFYDFKDIDQALADSNSGRIIKAVLRISKQD